jgi:hypothetical protein
MVHSVYYYYHILAVTSVPSRSDTDAAALQYSSIL